MEADNVLSAEFNCNGRQEAQRDTSRDNRKEQKDMEEPIKTLQEQISALKFEVHKREFCIKRFENDNESISFYTGFPNFETVMVCFKFVANSVQNISYGKYDKKFLTPHLLSVLVQPGRCLCWMNFFLCLFDCNLGF